MYYHEHTIDYDASEVRAGIEQSEFCKKIAVSSFPCLALDQIAVVTLAELTSRYRYLLTWSHCDWSLCPAVQALTLPCLSNRALPGSQVNMSMLSVLKMLEAVTW